jgi:hypothetical protein
MVRARVLCLLGILAVSTALWADKDKDLTLSVLGTYASGIFTGADNNPNELPGSEIAAYDRQTRRVFITNAFNRTIDIVSIANPSSPEFVEAIDVSSGRHRDIPSRGSGLHPDGQRRRRSRMARFPGRGSPHSVVLHRARPLGKLLSDLQR